MKTEKKKIFVVTINRDDGKPNPYEFQTEKDRKEFIKDVKKTYPNIKYTTIEIEVRK